MVTLVITALGLLSALALFDAVQAWRVAALAADDVHARAAAWRGLTDVRTPPDLPWLCLQPPHAAVRRSVALDAGSRLELVWWTVVPGNIRAEVTGLGPAGGRHRWLLRLRPDSLPSDPWVPGCPSATRLWPADSDWVMAHPEG